MTNMIDVSWTALKSSMQSKGIASRLQWVQEKDRYDLYLFDGPMILHTIIKITNPKNADQHDFETQFKNVSNLALDPVIRDNSRLISKSIQGKSLSGSGALIYQVPSQKTFHLTGIFGSFRNKGADEGRFTLQDGKNENKRMSFEVPSNGVLPLSISLSKRQMPIQTDLRIFGLVGDIVASFTVTGQLEE